MQHWNDFWREVFDAVYAMNWWEGTLFCALLALVLFLATVCYFRQKAKQFVRDDLIWSVIVALVFFAVSFMLVSQSFVTLSTKDDSNGLAVLRNGHVDKINLRAAWGWHVASKAFEYPRQIKSSVVVSVIADGQESTYMIDYTFGCINTKDGVENWFNQFYMSGGKPEPWLNWQASRLAQEFFTGCPDLDPETAGAMIETDLNQFGKKHGLAIHALKCQSIMSLEKFFN